MSTLAATWTPDCGLTPYRIGCRGSCGRVHLTEEQYSQQLSRPDALWQCPKCGDDAWWDDAWYEGFLDSQVPEDDGSS